MEMLSGIPVGSRLKLSLTAMNVVTVWAQIMETLLRYDWRNEPYETIEDVWSAYCTMQDVLMNLFDSEQALTQSLAYARDNEIRHAGNPF